MPLNGVVLQTHHGRKAVFRLPKFSSPPRRPGGSPVTPTGFEPRTWDDVVLEQSVRTAIEHNTVEVFRRREAFRRNGVPLKRGIILHGAPGTGKTLVGKVLAGLNLATFVYVTAADMSGLESVRSIFELARRLSPTILFFEDIDLFADDRSEYCSKALLGEILAQLDGFETNDGLVFIATTNDLAAIDPAIRERPSRFDVVIHIELPSREARWEILRSNLPLASGNDMLIDDAMYATEGLSGAQVREVAYLALQHAILRTTDAEGHVQLAREDLAGAITRVKAKKDAGLGFHTVQ
jgi:cell division protease FtsH